MNIVMNLGRVMKTVGIVVVVSIPQTTRYALKLLLVGLSTATKNDGNRADFSQDK